MAGLTPSPKGNGTGYRGIVGPLLLPTWAVIGIFLVLPVLLMAVYSFLTKDEIAWKLDGNDLPNGRAVMAESGGADFILPNG